MLHMGSILVAIHLRLAPRRHTVLLIAIIAAFLVRPLLGNSGLVTPFSLLHFVLLLLAFYNIDVDDLVGDREILLAQKRRRIIVALALGVPALAERLIIAFVSSPSLNLIGSALWLLLFAFITWNELRAVLRQREITQETISMAISVYLLFGMTYGLYYIVLHDLQPEACSFGAA
jgi:hypothetical protein